MDLQLTSCPYRDLCPGCPGDNPSTQWIPVKGFKQVTEGIQCLDWTITISVESVQQLAISEGRHLSGVDSADKIDSAWKKWNHSQKRLESQRKYEDTEKGKKTRERHIDSEKFKMTQQKYRFSDKGQQTYKSAQSKQKLLRDAAKWLKEHPDKTFNDYLVYLEEMQNNA